MSVLIITIANVIGERERKRSAGNATGADRNRVLYDGMEPEADLGMFSMFGRTGAPQKGGPTKAQKNSFFATW